VKEIAGALVIRPERRGICRGKMHGHRCHNEMLWQVIHRRGVGYVTHRWCGYHLPKKYRKETP
jgi:hypothetical protein